MLGVFDGQSLLRDFIYFLFFFLFRFVFFRLMLISWSGADVCLFVLMINWSGQLPEKLELPSHSFVDHITGNIYNYLVCTHI